jgi:hypothetical protein
VAALPALASDDKGLVRELMPGSEGAVNKLPSPGRACVVPCPINKDPRVIVINFLFIISFFRSIKYITPHKKTVFLISLHPSLFLYTLYLIAFYNIIKNRISIIYFLKRPTAG